jgi:hypothetical protein
MQRSSQSIASLAAALAKAQIALANPEKSLVAKIPGDGPGSAERSFRYASLASGLDIVRKTLGEHEIATVQTTAIDQGAGIINLTTVLAHSSGEWIASDWPVCAIAETATPQRMGAALTYARRYALFTLVGIAGEDDLDAPDLIAPSGRGAEPEKTELPGTGRFNRNGRTAAPSSGDGKAKISPRTILSPGASAELRDQLVGQIAEIGSADDAALWAYCNMRAKNGLSAADARQVEQAFDGKLAGFTDPTQGLSAGGQDLLPDGSSSIVPQAQERTNPDAPSPVGASAPHGKTGDTEQPPRSSEPAPAARRRQARRAKSIDSIDKTVLSFPEPRRIRDREHVRFVAKQPCLACGRIPSDPHHLRFAQNRALGRKVSDEFTVPLCRGHHREVHRCGDELGWWLKLRIDPAPAARALWLQTHPLPSPSPSPHEIA